MTANNSSDARFRVARAEAAPDAIAAIAGTSRAAALGVADDLARVVSKLQRRVGGYNVDAFLGDAPDWTTLLVGSEGTLAFSTAITLDLARLPAHRVMGVCQFRDFASAMCATPALVALDPVAVELVDDNVLRLGAALPEVAATLRTISAPNVGSLLLVKFAGEAQDDLSRRLVALEACMADLGYPNAVMRVVEPARQGRLWAVREACLNILMSMKGDAKPVSFIDDCAIAEEAFDLVRRFGGSHSGEHGDGISRSQFHRDMFGARVVEAFETVKDSFDPQGRLNPGKIVRPYAMDDRALMRFAPGYETAQPPRPALPFVAWGGFGAAVEMRNNNGTCRKASGGVMCPSWRVTRDETHVTRGRANTLRLAASGRLGPDALAGEAEREAMELCVSCKACRSECPTGVDNGSHEDRSDGAARHASRSDVA